MKILYLLTVSTVFLLFTFSQRQRTSGGRNTVQAVPAKQGHHFSGFWK
jgi:hypothetical protein